MPLVAFLEAFVGIGVLVPGVILLSICTVLYVEQIATLWQMLPLAFAGAALSDHCGYYFGRWMGPRFHNSQFAQNRAKLLNKAERQIVKYGNYAILIGRLVTAVRSIVPLLIGVSGMSRLKYTIYDLAACGIWVTGLGLLVMGIGEIWS